MPRIGEVKRGKEIGKVNRYKHTWVACEICRKERWVLVYRGKPISLKCQSCAAGTYMKARVREKHPQWKGGRLLNSGGYISIKLNADDFFYSMVQKNGYVLEHRLVVAKALGRCLHRWEIVHHKHNKYPAGSVEDKRDNRYPENLQLVSDDRHIQITILENHIKKLQEENQDLRVRLMICGDESAN